MLRKTNFFFSVLILLMFVFSCYGLAKNNDVSEKWLTAYELYENAEKSFDNNDYSSALAYFKRAYELFGDISKEKPDWNRSLVQYRVKHCKARIELIQEKINKSYQTKSFSELAGENVKLQNKIADFRSILIKEQRKLKSALTNLEKSQKELVRSSLASKQLAEVVMNRNKLERKNKILSAQIEELNSQKMNDIVIDNLRKAITRHKKQILGVQEQKKQIEKNYEQLKDNYKELSLAQAKVKLERDESIADLKNMKQAISIYDDKFEKINLEFHRLQSEKKYLKLNLDELKTRLDNEKNRTEKLSSNLQTKSEPKSEDIKKLMDVNNSLRKELLGNQNKIDQLNKLRESYSIELKELRVKYDSRSKELSQFNNKHNSIQAETDILRKKLEDEKNKTTKFQDDIQRLNKNLEREKESYKLLAEKYRKVEKEKASLDIVKEENKELKEEKNSLDHLIDNYQKQIVSIKNERDALSEAEKVLQKERERLLKENKNINNLKNSEIGKKIVELKYANNKIEELEKQHINQKKRIKNLLENANIAEESLLKIQNDNIDVRKNLLEANKKIENFQTEQKKQLDNMKALLDNLENAKKIEDCNIIPVILDLINEEDIEKYINKVSKRKRQTAVAVRLHTQAYKQGAVMSYSDTAAIMRLSPSTVGSYIREFEKETGESVPRRGNVHDLGPTLTHKRQICMKHLIQGKSVEQTARETFHSAAAVVRYANDYKRVYTCLKGGWDLNKIKTATGLSESLTKEYIDLIEENSMN